MCDESLKEYLSYVKSCLNELYDNEGCLFKNNLCERALVFRFAYHLQNKFNDVGCKYFADCDYNSSVYFDKQNKKWKRKSGKPIPDSDQSKAKITKRFIDVIVHKRGIGNSNIICFEIKKWNYYNKSGIKKDKNNLKVLTSQYGYKYGFHLIFGKNKEETTISIFKNGKKIYNKQEILKDDK